MGIRLLSFLLLRGLLVKFDVLLSFQPLLFILLCLLFFFLFLHLGQVLVQLLNDVRSIPVFHLVFGERFFKVLLDLADL